MPIAVGGGGRPVEDETTAGQISRRRLLKRIGAGTTIAWTAPVLMSIMTPAFAQGSPIPRDCTACQAPGGDPCFVDCGQGVNGQCFCGLKTDGTCSCFFPACNAPGTGPCTDDAGCPAGYACVQQCCGQPTCAPLCDTPVAAAAPAAGQPWAH